MDASVPRFDVTRFTWQEDLFYLPLSVRNYAETALTIFRRHGDVVRRRLPNPVVLFFHPAHARHILRTRVLDYPKSHDYDFLRPLLGNGLFVSEGRLWTQQRKLVAPEFRADAVLRFVPTMVECIESLFERWERSPGQVRDISDDLMRLTLWVVGAAMFDSDFRAEAEAIGDCLETCLTVATRQMMSMGLYRRWMPTLGNHRVRRAERTLDDIVQGLVVRARRGQLRAPSVLSRLVLAADEATGSMMSDRQLLDEVKSIILAGHETTSLALAWALYVLQAHPEVEAKIAREAQRVLGRDTPTAEHVPRLVYTRQVLLETMRLYPPVPAVSREARIDDELPGGVRLLAGQKVIVFPYVTHRHPRFWLRSEVFDPDRFSPARVEARDPYCYLPFLHGRRACVGEHFAMVEGVLALAMIVQRYRMVRTDTTPIGIRPISTLRMSRPLTMTVSRR